MNKKTLLIPAVAITLVGATLFISTQVSAQSGYGYGQTLVQKLAQKLGLGESNVQSALDDIRKENQAERQKIYEERLSQLVTEGKITEAQKQAILKKHAQLQTQRENNRAEMETWAKQNGLEWPIMFGLKGGGYHGMGRMHW